MQVVWDIAWFEQTSLHRVLLLVGGLMFETFHFCMSFECAVFSMKQYKRFSETKLHIVYVLYSTFRIQ